MALMYTPHPSNSKLTAFVPSSLVAAAQNEVSVSFSELLEMRRVIEELSIDLRKFKPDLIPFFATGGIPFMIPAMHALYAQKCYGLVDGSHFHMFPGLSWSGRLNGVDSESYFVKEFGELIKSVTGEDGQIRIWTMDATFTGNAIRKLLSALHRTFQALPIPSPKATVSLLAVIDASRAHHEPKDDALTLESPHGKFYLSKSSEYSPSERLIDRHPIRFFRNKGDDLFDLTVEYRMVNTIPTEDRYELIGAISNKEVLGIKSNHQVGRLIVKHDNGYSETGTGGNGVGGNVLSWLGKTEDQLPWIKWLEVEALPPLEQGEEENYNESKRYSVAGLRMFELSSTTIENVIDGLLKKPGLLEGVEIYCLKEQAYRQFKLSDVSLETLFSEKLLRKVLASTRVDSKAVTDALELFRICRLELVGQEPVGESDQGLLDWWDMQLTRSYS